MDALVGGGMIAAVILLMGVAVLLLLSLKSSRATEGRIGTLGEAAEASKKAAVELTSTLRRTMGAIHQLLQKQHADTHSQLDSTIAALGEVQKANQRDNAASNERLQALDTRIQEASSRLLQALQGSLEAAAGNLAASSAEIVALLQRESAAAREHFVKVEGRLAETLAARLQEFSGIMKGHEERLVAEASNLSRRVAEVVAGLDDLKKSLAEAVRF